MKVKPIVIAACMLAVVRPALACPQCDGFLSGKFKTIIDTAGNDKKEAVYKLLQDKTLSELTDIRDKQASERQGDAGGSYDFGFIDASVSYMESKYSDQRNTHRFDSTDFQNISSILSTSTSSVTHREFVSKDVLDAYNKCLEINCRGLKIQLNQQPVGTFPAEISWLPENGVGATQGQIVDVAHSGNIQILSNVDASGKWISKDIRQGSPVLITFKRLDRAEGSVSIATDQLGSTHITFPELKDSPLPPPPPVIIQTKVAVGSPMLWIAEPQPPGIPHEIEGSTFAGAPKVTPYAVPGVPADAKIISVAWTPADLSPNEIRCLPDFSLIKVEPSTVSGNIVNVSVAGYPNNVTHLRINITVTYQKQ